jgi:hypothetical protein
MKINLHNVQIEKIQTMADRSIQIRVGMREMSPEEMSSLFQSLNSGEHTIELDADASEGKSPAQRLRAVIFKYWELCRDENGVKWNEIYTDFNLFYAYCVENHIKKYKKELDKTNL